MDGHTKFVGTLAWSSSMIYLGSRDTSILQRDPRAHESFVSKLNGHKSGRSKKMVSSQRFVWSKNTNELVTTHGYCPDGGIPAIPDQTRFEALKIQWEMWTRTRNLYNQLILRQKYHMRCACRQNTKDLLHTLLRLKDDGG
ncbi:FIZZY-related 2-like protein [Tanacetum coccineum]